MTLQHPFQATGARLRQAFATLIRALAEPLPLETDALRRADEDRVFHVVDRRRTADERRERAARPGVEEERDEV